mgnify:CR=1 FL=1|jgi:effector-binding domain-containing protein
MVSIELKIERLHSMRAVNVQAQGSNPEEEAMAKIFDYAKRQGFMDKPDVRLFGRNFYPTDQPEPHGYEYFLTTDEETEVSGEETIKVIPEGLYATMRVKGVFEIPQGWKALFSMVESSGYKQVGVSKQAYGWVNAGFEEFVNWQQELPPNEWVFNLWLQLKE